MGTIGRNGFAAPASMLPAPWTPFTGVTPWAGQSISGAQNLSGFLRFLPGHWALGLQKLPLLRFHWCAWLGRANAPGPFSAVGAALAAARKPTPLGADSPFQGEMAEGQRG